MLDTFLPCPHRPAVRGPAAGHTDHSILPPDTPSDTSAADPAAAAGTAAAWSQGPHMMDIGPPIMYSVFYEDQGLADAAGLNLRASWLAGQRVYGPVLLAGSGIMRGAVSHLLITSSPDSVMDGSVCVGTC